MSHSNNNHLTGVVPATRRRSSLESPIMRLTEGKYWVIVNTAVSLQSFDEHVCTCTTYLPTPPVSCSSLWFCLWCGFSLAAGQHKAASSFLIWSSHVLWSSLSSGVAPVWRLINDSHKSLVCLDQWYMRYILREVSYVTETDHWKPVGEWTEEQNDTMKPYHSVKNRFMLKFFLD